MVAWCVPSSYLLGFKLMCWTECTDIQRSVRAKANMKSDGVWSLAVQVHCNTLATPRLQTCYALSSTESGCSSSSSSSSAGSGSIGVLA